jgi:hypothetical protein
MSYACDISKSTFRILGGYLQYESLRNPPFSQVGYFHDESSVGNDQYIERKLLECSIHPL